MDLLMVIYGDTRVPAVVSTPVTLLSLHYLSVTTCQPCNSWWQKIIQELSLKGPQFQSKMIYVKRCKFINVTRLEDNPSVHQWADSVNSEGSFLRSPAGTRSPCSCCSLMVQSYSKPGGARAGAGYKSSDHVSASLGNPSPAPHQP